ncbi:energy transducer TonB [Undibacterium seohonense]|uniref:Energy transducer TonB n=1 Tax=Undibacterium seohonense TaxID=1344950 RepID=A0ABR6X970_9BURK|nr:M56 family metallopeptidase [Undibacterium seohonense]MBC3809451.1 energy transducer TonB [Undibacterium seohonense]
MNFDFQFLTNAIGWALVNFLWQGLAIALVTAFLLQICRNGRAQTRYLIACLSLSLCFLVPIWELLQSLQTTKEFIGAQVSSSSFVESKAALAWTELTQIWFQLHIDFIVITWAIVVAILALRLLLGVFWLRSYSNGKRGVSNSYWQQKTDQLAARFQIDKSVLVRIVQDLESPITIGWIRPMILVPASLVTGMTPSYLEALIAHELAHISRFDYLINFIQNLIEMVLFFHPAVWWISKKIRTERENIADDLAASMLGEPRRLALALQELEYIQFTTPQLAQAAHGGNLMSRIKRLIRPEVQSVNWKTAVTALSISAVCFGMVANASVGSIQTTKTNAPVLSKELNGRINFASSGCQPEYPKISLVKQETGVTRLKVFMAADGKIEKVDVVKSSGWTNLDSAVTEQLLSGKCKGTVVKSKGASRIITTQVEYVWKLD